VLEDNSLGRYSDKEYASRLTLSVKARQVLAEISKQTVGMASGAARKQGYLKKAGVHKGKTAKFEKRWVVLNANQLMYYKKEGDKVPKGFLDLALVNKVEMMAEDEEDDADDEQITFVVKLMKSDKLRKDKRAYMFVGADNKDATAWVNAIRANMAHMKDQSAEAAAQRKTKNFTIRDGVLVESQEEVKVEAFPTLPGQAGKPALPALPWDQLDDDDEEGGAGATAAATEEPEELDEAQQKQLERMTQFLSQNDDDDED